MEYQLYPFQFRDPSPLTDVRRPNLSSHPRLAIAAGAAAGAAGAMLIRAFVPGHRKVRMPRDGMAAIDDPQFARTMDALLGAPLIGGNRVLHLCNGDGIFPPMLHAIETARHTINFEMFVWWEGRATMQFAEALAERAAAGVRVNLLIDTLSHGVIPGRSIRLLKRSGVQLQFYSLIEASNVAGLNQRTHRKILVVDGRIGFTGGFGIGDEWLGDADGPEQWRDSGFQVEGPAVAYLQSAFLDNWLKTRAEVLHGPDYFPELTRAGDMRCQVFPISPREGRESGLLAYLLSIEAAVRHLRVANAYFVPETLLSRALVAARQRGVEVEIIVPGRFMDHALVRAASRAQWGPLLEAGVRIYEYEPTMFHAKYMIVDGLWVMAGSANFDNRSLRLHHEVNLHVLDEGFARAMRHTFERDKAQTNEVSHRDWRTRPLRQKVLDRMAGVLRFQL